MMENCYNNERTCKCTLVCVAFPPRRIMIVTSDCMGGNITVSCVWVCVCWCLDLKTLIHPSACANINNHLQRAHTHTYPQTKHKLEQQQHCVVVELWEGGGRKKGSFNNHGLNQPTTISPPSTLSSVLKLTTTINWFPHTQTKMNKAISHTHTLKNPPSKNRPSSMYCCCDSVLY